MARFTLDYKWRDPAPGTARSTGCQDVAWDPTQGAMLQGWPHRDESVVTKTTVGRTSPRTSRHARPREVAKLKADYRRHRPLSGRAKREQGTGRADGQDVRPSRCRTTSPTAPFAARSSRNMPAGARSTYRGKGVFDVDYHAEGVLTQDFAIPGDARFRPDPSLHRHSPPRRRGRAGQRRRPSPAVPGRSARGRWLWACRTPTRMVLFRWRAAGFTITTDGEILTNNSEDGPSAPRRRQAPPDVGCWRQARRRSPRRWSGSSGLFSSSLISVSSSTSVGPAGASSAACASPCSPPGSAGR